MTMLAETRKALRSSISKWRRWAAGKMRRDEAVGPESCDLCFLCWFEGCRGCPVRAKTGRTYCSSTPAVRAYRAFDRHGRTSPEFKSAAAKEVEFLESLLPKGGSSMPERKPLTRKATRR
jgi:hypothetical protein